MWFLKRRANNEENTWTLYEGTWSGHPAIIRANTSVRRRRDMQRAMPYEVKIVVPIREPDIRGFPRGVEAAQLQNIEERLVAEVEVEGETILVGVLTGDGIREFALYTSAPYSVRTKLVRLANGTTTHNVQFAVQEDPDWSVYKSIVS